MNEKNVSNPTNSIVLLYHVAPSLAQRVVPKMLNIENVEPFRRKWRSWHSTRNYLYAAPARESREGGRTKCLSIGLIFKVSFCASQHVEEKSTC